MNVLRFGPAVAHDPGLSVAQVDQLGAAMMFEPVVQDEPLPGITGRVRLFIYQQAAGVAVGLERVMLAHDDLFFPVVVYISHGKGVGGADRVDPTLSCGAPQRPPRQLHADDAVVQSVVPVPRCRISRPLPLLPHLPLRYRHEPPRLAQPAGLTVVVVLPGKGSSRLSRNTKSIWKRSSTFYRWEARTENTSPPSITSI